MVRATLRPLTGVCSVVLHCCDAVRERSEFTIHDVRWNNSLGAGGDCDVALSGAAFARVDAVVAVV